MPDEWRPRVSFVDVAPETITTFNKFIPSGERMRVLGQVMEMFAYHLRTCDNPHSVVADLIMQQMCFQNFDVKIIRMQTFRQVLQYMYEQERTIRVKDIITLLEREI